LPSVFTRWHDLVETASRFTPEQLAELLYTEPDLQLVDVRNPGETADGVIHGAREIPLPSLTDSIDSLDYRVPVVTYCASGYRSLVAASLLRAAGFHAVADLMGGYDAWQESGAA
jgi:rhodanese-related sulfurtransferase